MDARLFRDERTQVLGPLDLFPATGELLTDVEAPVHVARLSSGLPVLVRGASVVPERSARPDEELFSLGPSWILRLRRGARAAIAAGPRGALAELKALSPLLRAVRVMLRSELSRARRAALGTLADLRRVDAVQRRTAAGAFLAGVVLSTLVAWIV